MSSPEYLDCLYALEDDQFDLIYPPQIRQLSFRHWTPVTIARRAAEFLVSKPGARVLDIGCGPGKFCIVGAVMTAGHFTGVEQRPHLTQVARETIAQAKISNAEVIQGNATDVDFSRFDAFYLFNPFEENLFMAGKIDASVALSNALYEKYTEHVATQLALAPLGTRVATYCGDGQEVPLGYECQACALDANLKFWVKILNHPVNQSPLAAAARSSRWQSILDTAALGFSSGEPEEP